MRKTNEKSYFCLLLLLALPITAQAQFGNFLKDLKDLKSLAESAQKQVTEQAEQKTAPQPLSAEKKPQAERSIEASLPKSSAEPAKKLSPALEFRASWCPKVDNSILSPTEYRSLKTGDLCLFPDETITALLDELKKKKIDYDKLEEMSYFELLWVKAGEHQFPSIRLLFIPRTKNVYVLQFSALLCPSNQLNSLAESNSFRVSLEQKYGKPSFIFTEYDQLKAQVDEAENMMIQQKKNARTVAEAKSVRDGEQQVNILKQLLTAADKNMPTQIAFWYSPKDAIETRGVLVYTIPVSNLREGLRCPGNLNNAYGVTLTATNPMANLFSMEQKITREKGLAKERNAPVPKL